MAFFKQIKQVAALNRFQEQKLYERVFLEIQSGIRIEGIWAMALAQSSGNKERAEARYIKLRVQSLIDEKAILDGVTDKSSTYMDKEYPPKPSKKKSSSESWIPYSYVEVMDYVSILKLNRDAIVQQLQNNTLRGRQHSGKWHIKKEDINLLKQQSNEYMTLHELAKNMGLTLKLESHGIAVMNGEKQIRFYFNLKKLSEYLTNKNKHD